MFDHALLKQECHDFWEKQPTDTPSLNSFDGEFNFSDWAFVPELIRELVLSQRNEDKFLKVPLDVVNDIANKFWEGPGSCARISDVIWECRIARAHGATFTQSKDAYTLNYSIKDWEAWADGRGD